MEQEEKGSESPTSQRYTDFAIESWRENPFIREMEELHPDLFEEPLFWVLRILFATKKYLIINDEVLVYDKSQRKKKTLKGFLLPWSNISSISVEIAANNVAYLTVKTLRNITVRMPLKMDSKSDAILPVESAGTFVEKVLLWRKQELDRIGSLIKTILDEAPASTRIISFASLEQSTRIPYQQISIAVQDLIEKEQIFGILYEDSIIRANSDEISRWKRELETNESTNLDKFAERENIPKNCFRLFLDAVVKPKGFYKLNQFISPKELRSKIRNELQSYGKINAEEIAQQTGNPPISLIIELAHEIMPGISIQDESCFFTERYLRNTILEVTKYYNDPSFAAIAEALGTKEKYVEALLLQMLKKEVVEGQISSSQQRFISYIRPEAVIDYKTELLSKEKICWYCGAIVTENTEICPDCGKEVLGCSICRKTINFGEIVGQCIYCDNKFHEAHLMESVKVQGICPICREPITESEILVIDPKAKKR